MKAATQTHAELRDGPFRDFRVGLLHGRQDEETKAAVMESFRKHELDLLVCTSVIEVGVDVPNATLLVIEHAERFGLSQLHQLRGRVSRGPAAGQCYLFADPPGDEGRQRLRALLRTTDGFALAEEDMKLRGIGEFFGTRQHGLGELRVGDLIADGDLLPPGPQRRLCPGGKRCRIAPAGACAVARGRPGTLREDAGSGGDWIRAVRGSFERGRADGLMEFAQQTLQIVEIILREFAE